MIFEKMKSGILAILFASCILLAGQLLLDFKGSSSETIATQTASLKPINYENILYPQSCSISFGGGLYKGVFSTEVKQNLWQESRKYIKNYVDYLEISKISQEEWDTAVKFKAVRFVMPFSMSVAQLQSLLSDQSLKSGAENMNFDTIIMPINEDDSIYLGKRTGGEYYLLTGVKRDVYLNSLLTQYEKNANTYEAKTIEELYGPSKVLSQVNEPFLYNQVLFPISKIANIPFIKVENELNVSNLSQQDLKQYVGKAFGYRNDFLKKIEDIDGSLVYLYGYGDRALKIGADGIITYKKRYEKQPGNENYTFNEAIAIAINELQIYGSLPNGYYLSGYKESKDKDNNVVKQLTFNYELENLPIYREEDLTGQPMVVEITQSQVTSVKRKLSNYLRTFSVDEIWDEPMAILDILEFNYDVISKNFEKNDYKAKPNTATDPSKNPNFASEMLQSIQSVNLVYYGNSDKSGSLVPAWQIRVGSNEYIINIYSGEILKWIPPEGVK